MRVGVIPVNGDRNRCCAERGGAAVREEGVGSRSVPLPLPLAGNTNLDVKNAMWKLMERNVAEAGSDFCPDGGAVGADADDVPGDRARVHAVGTRHYCRILLLDLALLLSRRRRQCVALD